MPELPEIETIARGLDRVLRGAAITGVEVRRADVLREVTPARLRARTRGVRLVRAWRRAKLAVVDLSSGDHLVVQPRFTGALFMDEGDLPERERRYTTVAFALDDGRRLIYRDVRRLGTVTLMTDARFTAYTDALGIEPFDPAFTDACLLGLLRASKQAIKKVIMDQRRVVGIGNIYANEALWRAGIDPSRSAASITRESATRLHTDILEVLREAIAARGTSFRDYLDSDGNEGGFAIKLAAYGRGGEPCNRCGRRLVDTHAIDGRTTVLCTHCQA